MKTIGYARVSTSGQTLDAQLEQLGVAGCDPVFKETMSGARNDRPELMKALATLMEGDVLIVTRLDRYRPHDRNQGREVEGAYGFMGRHHHAHRQAHSHRLGWSCRIRAILDRRADSRRP